MNPILTGSKPFVASTLTNEETEVNIRLLRITEFPEYFAKCEDEEALAAFVTNRDQAFVQTLSVDSILSICELAHDLNFQNACRWANRRANLNTALLPVAQKGIRLQQSLQNSVPSVASSSEKP
jgi:hypothetical protein